MDKLRAAIPFVKGQVVFHEKMASRANVDPKRKATHEEIASNFRAVLAAMDEAMAQLEAIPKPLPPESNPLELSPEDLAGLPEDLLAQLNITESDKLDATIVETIQASGGTMLLDKLLIALYKRTGEVQQRGQLISRLYRLSKKGKVFSVPRKKGYYTTERPTVVEEAPENEEPSSTSPS
jgi:hypothetical protein